MLTKNLCKGRVIKIMEIIIEGMTQQEVMNNIATAQSGWRLFPTEPNNADFTFLVPFFGFKWDGQEDSLRNLMSTKTKVNGVLKHCIWVFQLDGKDRFAYCTWTHQLYDFKTKEYHIMLPKYATNITFTINSKVI